MIGLSPQYPELQQLLQQLGLGSIPGTAPGSGDISGNDATEQALTQQGLQQQQSQFSAQALMQMARMRAAYAQQGRPMGGRPQGLGQGALPANATTMPQSQYPGAFTGQQQQMLSQQAQPGGLLGAFGG